MIRIVRILLPQLYKYNDIKDIQMCILVTHVGNTYAQLFKALVRLKTPQYSQQATNRLLNYSAG